MGPAPTAYACPKEPWPPTPSASVLDSPASSADGTPLCMRSRCWKDVWGMPWHVARRRRIARQDGGVGGLIPLCTAMVAQSPVEATASKAPRHVHTVCDRFGFPWDPDGTG